MMLKLHNTLSKSTDEFVPIRQGEATIYSCGPTVYSIAHIGNLSTYVVADTLRRVIAISGLKVTQVMNYTDIDDKTIARSQELYGKDNPKESLTKLTREVEEMFSRDLKSIGVDTDAIKFVRATESIKQMQNMIVELFESKIAYIADDGVYFSIEAYTDSGHKYGQLTEITAASTGAARVNNDEYDKENIHDFALWKKERANEPSWLFEINGQDMTGRPGWHIECSAMAKDNLGQPFDIHTGGVDLVFPHHENEIAQSTGSSANKEFAKFFIHNEHLLVDGRKMAKSLGNVYLMSDIEDKGFDPLAFRLLVLQSHYRHQANFSWDNLASAANRLDSLKSLAVVRFQEQNKAPEQSELLRSAKEQLLAQSMNDLNTPKALSALSETIDSVTTNGARKEDLEALLDLLHSIDSIFGLQLMETEDLSSDQKQLLDSRAEARTQKKFDKSDKVRGSLAEQGIAVKDTPSGQLWSWSN